MSFLTSNSSVGVVSASPRIRIPFRLIERTVMAGDFVLILAASVLSGIAYHWVTLETVGDIVAFIGIGAFVCFNFMAVFSLRRNYKPRALADFRDQVHEVTLIWLAVCMLWLAIAFSLKTSDSYSRGATFAFFASGWLILIGWRAFLARALTRALAEGGFAQQRVVVLAARGQSTGSKAVEELKLCGFTPVHTLELNVDGPADLESSSNRALLDDLINASRKERIDQIFLLLPWHLRGVIDAIVEGLRVLSIPIHLLPDNNVAHFLNNRVASLGTTWSAELKRAPLSEAEQSLKRALDIVLALLASLMLGPLMLVVAILIKIDSPGPVFFGQLRNGFNGRSFRMLKFRSMRVLEDGPEVRQATRHDPRVTRVGRLLRRTSIDELPQLFNVLAGDMSLVGPRPHAAAHNSQYEKLIGNYAFRYHMKPGITGWAQIKGFRGETATVELMERRVEADLWYIENWSLWLDTKILLKTMVLGLQARAY